MDMGIRKSNSDTFDGVCLKAKEYLSQVSESDCSQG